MLICLIEGLYRVPRLAELGISLPAPSADAVPATMYEHSTWRPISDAER